MDRQILDANGNAIETKAIATREATLDAGLVNLLDPVSIDGRAKEILEAAGVYRDTMMRIVLRQTAVSQWVIFAGDGRENVYPMGAAAAAMFAFFGLHWSTPGPTDTLYDAELYVEKDGTQWWRVESKLWRGDKFITSAVGKRKLGEGYAKNELDAQLGAFENLQSRACRSVFGLGAKSRDELKALGIDLTNARQASFQDHKSGLASDPNEAVIRWGRMKGMKVSEIADTDLSYYLNAEKKSLADPEKAKYKKSIEAMITALETEIAKRAKVAEGNPELDSLLIHIREECAALGVPEDKVEAGIKSATTVDIAKKWLEQLRARRKKAADEAAAPEPGSRG